VNSKPRRVPEDDVSECSMECRANSSPEGEVTRLELGRELSVPLAALTERDHRIAQLTDELALKSALLEQSEANAAEAAKRAGLELREHADRLLVQTSLVEQRDAELVDMQARLRDVQARLDKLLPSRDQQVGQYEKELTNVRTKLEAKESELEAVRSRLTDAKDGWAKSKAKADKLNTVTAGSLVDLNEDRDMCEFKEDMEAGLASLHWNENDKIIEEMECRNEG
jgi:chromosome segregation ATPase